MCTSTAGHLTKVLHQFVIICILCCAIRPFLQAGGSNALQELLKREEEEALPEFKRVRPKYHYYYNWMRERVAHSCGQLPPPIMEKLIRIDATELDMLLTYPNGIQQQV